MSGPGDSFLSGIATNAISIIEIKEPIILPIRSVILLIVKSFSS